MQSVSAEYERRPFCHKQMDVAKARLDELG